MPGALPRGGVIHVRIALLIAALLLVQGCRFERRSDLGAERALPGETVELPLASGTPTEDSIRAIVAAVGEALGVGDASRVALLTAPGATLVDADHGTLWSRDDPAAPLPGRLQEADSPLAWSLARSRIGRFGDAALLVDEYRAPVAGGPEARAVETLLLVRSQEGWRLAHLHRGRLAESSQATP